MGLRALHALKEADRCKKSERESERERERQRERERERESERAKEGDKNVESYLQLLKQHCGSCAAL